MTLAHYETKLASARTDRAKERTPSNQRPALWTAAVVMAAAANSNFLSRIEVVRLGNYSFQNTDLIVLAVLTLIGWTLLTGRATWRRGPLGMVIGVSVGIWILAFARGVVLDQTAALISLRTTGCFALSVLAVTMLRREDVPAQKILNIFVMLGCVISLLPILRLLINPTFLYFGPPIGPEGMWDGGRPISAFGAIIVSVSIVVCTHRLFEKPRPKGTILSFLLLLIGLGLSGQGSATLGGLAGVTTLLYLMPGKHLGYRQFVILCVAGCIAVVWIFAPELLTIEGIADLLPNDMAQILLRRTVTFDGRTKVWEGLVQSFWGWSDFEKLFGLPSGVSPIILTDMWGGTYWSRALHSHYLGSLTTSGIIGTSAFILTGAGAFVSGCKRADARRLAPLGAAIVVAYLVFSVGYDLREEHAFMLAFGVLLTSATRSGSTTTKNGGDLFSPGSDSPQKSRNHTWRPAH